MAIIQLVMFITLIVLTLFLFYKKVDYKWIMAGIILIGINSRLHVISNPQLNNWDEKYHALVAKNLINTPLKPTLYKNPILPYSVTKWTENHIWLSKPPLPLWIMAGSMKIFGTNIYGVRIPSVLFAILGIFLTFLIGKKLFDEQTGLVAAFLYSINGLLIELVGGKVSSDHVENVFIVLFELSVLLFISSENKRTKKIADFIIPGFVAGLAFLSKWHVSFFIFIIWLVYFLFKKNSDYKSSFKLISLNILSFLITISGWLIFIMINYPIETKSILNGLIVPFTQSIQNHSGPWYYYIIKIGVIFGELVYLPIIYSIAILLRKKQYNSLLILVVWTIVPLILFSIAETKRFTYLLISAPAFFLIIANFLTTIISKLKKQWLIILSYLILLGLPIKYSLERTKYFEDRSKISEAKIDWFDNLDQFTKTISTENTVIFNDPNFIETMFYSNLISYRFKPTAAQIKTIRKKGFHCYLYKNNGLYELINNSPNKEQEDL